MRTAVNIFIFVACFVLVAFAIGKVTPEPRVPIVTSKVTYFREEGEEFDVLFLGSSRTFRQVIPEMFDELLAAEGHKVKTFNLGVDGMRPPEDTYVLEQALSRRSKPLKWVFVECSPIRLVLRPEDRGTLRAIYWHDFDRTASLFRRAFHADEKKRKLKDRVKEFIKDWPDFHDHAEYFFQNFTQLGRGYVMLESFLFKGKLPDIPTWDLGKRRDGYRPSDQPEIMPPAERAIYERQVEKMRLKPPRVDYGDRASQEELRIKQRIIEKAGGKMILLMPPFTANRYFYPKKTGENDPLLLDFSSLEKYPELYAPENHSDSGHLNRAGSEIYTRKIVDALLDHLD